MSDVCYVSRRGSGSYCVSKETAERTGPAPGFGLPGNQEEARRMDMARRSELITEWRAFDYPLQHQVVVELGLDAHVLAGVMPSADVLADMVGLAEIKISNANVEAAIARRAAWDQLSGFAAVARNRADTMLDRRDRYQSLSSNGWGWFEGTVSEWNGDCSLPSVDGYDKAIKAIQDASAMISARDDALFMDAIKKAEHAENMTNAWINEMVTYIRDREKGGETSIKQLTFIRDSSAGLVSAWATGGSSLTTQVGGAMLSTGVANGITELAAVEAGVQDGKWKSRMLNAVAMNGVVALISGPVGEVAKGHLGKMVAKKIFKDTGREFSRTVVEEVIGQVFSTLSGAGIESVINALAGKDDVTAEELATVTMAKVGVDLTGKVAEILLNR